MKKIYRQILENQLAIMEALDYLMMLRRPKKEEYWFHEAKVQINDRRRKTGALIAEDNKKKNMKEDNHGDR